MEKEILKYSGSIYPGVPAIAVDICVISSLTPVFDKPKSANFASRLLSKRMLAVLTSLCTMGGLHPEWRYSRAAKQNVPIHIYCRFEQ